MSELKEKIKLFVANNSYIELNDDDDDSNEVRFTTRQNGNVGDEEPGQEDWNEIVRVAKLLKVEFPDKLKCTGETIDEWTDLIVKII
jgi:hypothetical protein